MKTVIADTGVLISLALVRRLDLIKKVFGEFFIADAVWKELKNYENPEIDKAVFNSLEEKVLTIKSSNYLSMIMDYGESESVILYKELNADYLLIDDQRARIIAESLDINCIGSIGLLLKAKQKGLIVNLKDIFEQWMKSQRYFSKKLLNEVLVFSGETPI